MTARNKLVVQLYEEYKDLMYIVAFHVLKNKDYAEDAVQATIEKILLKPEKFYEIKSDKVKNYVASTARNTALDMYRKNSLCRIREVSFEDINYTPSVGLALCEEDELDFPFNQLYDSYKEILYLKYECGYTLKEIGDILGISEANAKKRISRARKQLEKIVKTGTVVVLCIVILALTGVVINAAMDNKVFDIIKKLLGAEIITDENIDLIGNETHSTTYTYTDEGYETPKYVHLSNSRIIESMSEGAILPRAVSDIQTLGGIIPEMIVNINSCAVLYQADYSGWYCNKGDILCFNFSKYPHNTRETQQLIVGYVLDGTMYEGTLFDELNGCYQLSITEDGEYYIYLFNLDLDHLSMKSGNISIK